MKRFCVTLVAAILLTLTGEAAAQSLAGTWILNNQGTVLTLALQVDGQGNLGGRLGSNTGAQFTVEGTLQDGVGVGILSGSQGASYFEAHPQDGQLLLALIGVGQDSMPNYNDVQQLLFTRQAGAGSPPAIGQAPAQNQPPAASPFGQQPSPPAAQSPQAQPPSASPFGGSQGGAPQPSVGEVGDPMFGFFMTPPAGWKHQKNADSIVLGSDTVPGLIYVSPHQHASAAALQGDMASGITEEGVSMSLTGQVTQLGQGVLATEYSGVFSGEQARGYAIGTLSPHGGGAYIFAVTTPQMFGEQHREAARAIARSLRYVKSDAAAMMKHFAGYWWYYTGTSAISHERLIHLGPDGTFRQRGEDAADVSNYDQYGNVTSQYLGNQGSRDAGRWTVRGDKYRGVIVITRANGSSFNIEYQVKPSNNQKFGSYFFNGQEYHWVTEEQLKTMGY